MVLQKVPNPYNIVPEKPNDLKKANTKNSEENMKGIR